jgi:transposase InsO family protein
MRKDIEEYCEALRPLPTKMTENLWPLGDVQEPSAPFEVCSMDVTGSFLLTPRETRFLLTIVDHFSRYVEAYPMPDQKAEKCEGISASQIITRHGTGSQ